jgi:hypothetical protein
VCTSHDVNTIKRILSLKLINGNVKKKKQKSNTVPQKYVCVYIIKYIYIYTYSRTCRKIIFKPIRLDENVNNQYYNKVIIFLSSGR